jgi:hypothetical protein
VVLALEEEAAVVVLLLLFLKEGGTSSSAGLVGVLEATHIHLTKPTLLLFHHLCGITDP